MGVNISLNDSSWLSFLNVYALPIRYSPKDSRTNLFFSLHSSLLYGSGSGGIFALPLPYPWLTCCEVLWRDRHKRLIRITMNSRHNHRVFVVILMSRLWRSRHETSQHISKSISWSNVKIISKSLFWKDVQFGLDRAHVFTVDRYFV